MQLRNRIAIACATILGLTLAAAPAVSAAPAAPAITWTQ